MRVRPSPMHILSFSYPSACVCILPSVLWRCLLGGKKGIRPVKTEWWGADVVICLERGADLHMAQLMPLPLTASCFSKIQIGFTFLVPAHLGSPGKRADKRVCVCVCVFCAYLPRPRRSLQKRLKRSRYRSGTYSRLWAQGTTYYMGVHIRATWRIRWIDQCGSGDAA